MGEPAQDPGQRLAPYLEALVSFAARHPRRAMVPGHKGGLAADRGLRAALGGAALALDVPTLIEGIDLSAGDHADAVTDGGPELPAEAEPDLKDVAAAARQADADASS